MLKKLLIAIGPVFLGGLIYIVYRVKTLIMFDWFENYSKINDLVIFLRKNLVFKNISIPDWVLFSLPDALWLYSFTYIVLLLWDFKINKQSLLWISFPPLIGLFSELGQLIHIIPGTFDITDLIFLMIAIVAPFYYATNLKSIKL